MCKACRHLGLECEYKRPLWWSNNDARRKQKEQIKNIIKRTKTNEKASAIPSQYSATASTRPDSIDSDGEFDDNFDQPYGATTQFYDPYAHHMYTPHFAYPGAPAHSYPYEVDVRTERQMFINDIPTRHDSTISTFSTFVPPPPHAMLPSYTGDDWAETTYFENSRDEWSGEENLDFNFFDYSHGQMGHQSHSLSIPVDECDKELLDHLLESVLRLMFPVLETNQHGSVKQDVILPALENNKAYRHACLSAAAQHLKSTKATSSDTIDSDVLRHKFAFVTEVVNALSNDTNHSDILEATLGVIALQCVVGSADEQEKDIPWHQHFQAVTELVAKLDLPTILEDMPSSGVHPPFNMTVTAWIDILGSTMLGRAPAFANTYRNKHLNGATSGLAELMGCHDSIMYLLSEVACLDSLQVEKKLDSFSICSHITSLAKQLDATETPGEIPQMPYSTSGALRPRQLSKNITAIFRKATRIYLCSLVPNFNRYDPHIVALVAQLTDLLQYIPTGPEGFDRAIIWPLLICGANSIPTSPFRRAISERTAALGAEANQGNFGRVVKVLNEVWKRSDEISTSGSVCEVTPITARSPEGSISTPTTGPFSASVLAAASSTSTPFNPVPASVHWRDVMHEMGWDYLLI